VPLLSAVDCVFFTTDFGQFSPEGGCLRGLVAAPNCLPTNGLRAHDRTWPRISSPTSHPALEARQRRESSGQPKVPLRSTKGTLAVNQRYPCGQPKVLRSLLRHQRYPFGQPRTCAGSESCLSWDGPFRAVSLWFVCCRFEAGSEQTEQASFQLCPDMNLCSSEQYTTWHGTINRTHKSRERFFVSGKLRTPTNQNLTL